MEGEGEGEGGHGKRNVHSKRHGPVDLGVRAVACSLSLCVANPPSFVWLRDSVIRSLVFMA